MLLIQLCRTINSCHGLISYGSSCFRLMVGFGCGVDPPPPNKARDPSYQQDIVQIGGSSIIV